MKKKFRIYAFALALLLALLACSIPQEDAGGGNAVLTAAAETVAAQLTNQPQPFPSNTPAPLPEQPSATPIPSATSVSVSTATKTEIPCDQLAFVKDVTVPDDTKFDPGESFTKTWRIKNTGTCTWNSDYELVFDSGKSMSGPASKAVTAGTVAPGDTVDISINLKAPNTAGTHRGTYKIRNDSGVIFTNTGIWVQIKVVEPVAFAVTKVVVTVDDSTFSGACPHKFTFTGKITVNQAGTVTYKWLRSDGASSSEVDLTFASAGTKDVTKNWTFGGAGNTYTDYWQQVEIVSPNSKKSAKALFTLECDP